jgi:hypothetical protein
MKPTLTRELGQSWKRRNRWNGGAMDDQLNTELRNRIIATRPGLHGNFNSTRPDTIRQDEQNFQDELKR